MLSVDKCSENQEVTAGDEVSTHWGCKNLAISLEMKLVFNKILVEEILPGKNSHHFLISISYAVHITSVHFHSVLTNLLMSPAWIKTSFEVLISSNKYCVIDTRVIVPEIVFLQHFGQWTA